MIFIKIVKSQKQFAALLINSPIRQAKKINANKRLKQNVRGKLNSYTNLIRN